MWGEVLETTKNMHEIPEGEVVDIGADIARYGAMGILPTLLANRTTGGNIIWASNVFVDKGDSYAPTDEILVSDITGDNAGLIRTRASKAKEAQAALTRAHAEVFTPTWVVKLMVDEADKAWWESHEDATWQDYVRSPRLEITCGEAPYLVGRYDAADGTSVPLDERVGILDRKLRLVCEHTTARKTWVKYAHMALKSTYGYEFQGDNLLIARVNVLATIEDYARAQGYELPESTYRKFATVIGWNLWQMDGLTDHMPDMDGAGREPVDEPDPLGETPQLTGFDEWYASAGNEVVESEDTQGVTRVMVRDWDRGEVVAFAELKREGSDMKFDYVIGNPPYQDENATNGRQPPIYDKFMDCAYEVGNVTELITPARFLFNAGQTKKEWNRGMLEDRHLKVIMFEPDAIKVFPNTDIKGGVAVTLRDANRVIGPIGFFSPVAEMNPIISKVRSASEGSDGLDTIVSSQGLYKFSGAFFDEYPTATESMGSGTGSKIVSKFVESFDVAFIDALPKNRQNDYVGLLIRTTGGRAYRYLSREHVQTNPYLDTFNVLVPKANGSGKFGEVLSSPEISERGNGSSDTFISIGMFDTKDEAEALLKYLKTKFVRALLNAKKVTQDNPKAVWSLIPLQDFTPDSDIDWSKSVFEIDDQLFEKYGLDDDEAAFIKSHVKEMG